MHYCQDLIQKRVLFSGSYSCIIIEPMGRRSRILSILLVIASLAVLTGVGIAQSGTQEFIGDPGKWVSNEFLDYYHSSNDPLAIFGYPITIEFTDATTNMRVQYFQKARFDLEMTPFGTVVNSAPLGELLYETGRYAEAQVGGDSSVCHTFPNGKEVCYAFWQYYQSNQGESFLGAPISNTEVNEGGYLVQFFEKGLLEWHPEKAPGFRVVVADLGRIYFDEFVGDQRYTRNDPSNLPESILRVPNVQVYVSKAIVPPNSFQELYVVVTDQYKQPIPGALVGVTISLPDGRECFFRLPETDLAGISSLELTVGDLPPRDIVRIEAQVSTGGEPVKGLTWFRIWW